MNPARCFAYAISRGSFRDQWLWWFGPAAGAIIHTVVYRAVPPYHLQMRREHEAESGTDGGGGQAVR